MDSIIDLYEKYYEKAHTLAEKEDENKIFSSIYEERFKFHLNNLVSMHNASIAQTFDREVFKAFE